MGNPLFGIDISGLVNKNIGPGVNAATLTKVTPGERLPGALTAGTRPTSADYACRAFVDPISRDQVDGTLVRDGDARVQIVGDSVAGGQVPQVGDKVTVLSKTYQIVAVEVDPALALYTCQGRTSD